MKNILLFLVVITTMSAVTCKKDSATCHKRITFQNASAKDVYVSLHIENPQDELDENLYGSLLNNPQFQKVSAGDSNVSGLSSRSCIEGMFDYFKVEKATIFVFDANTIENTDKATLTKNHYFLKKYTVTINDLQKTNWRMEFNE